MAYCPPQKRVQTQAPQKKDKTDKSNKPKKEEFPELTSTSTPTSTPRTTPTPTPPKKELSAETKMNFAALFKNAKKVPAPVKKMKWGLVHLTKKGTVDSRTQEEYEEEEKAKQEVFQDNRLWKATDRIEKQQNIRREYDPRYESPEELVVSSSEDEEEEDHEELLTDEEYEEDEFEPEI